MSDFVHLHVHTSGSLLDGLTRAHDAVNTVALDGAPAIASTDHGTLTQTMAMAKAAAAAGVKYIPGLELYLSIGDRHERNHVIVPREDDFDGGGDEDTTGKRKIYEHLTVLAASKTGWRNLMRLDFDARATFYGKPRADYALLEQHAEGLIVGTGCLGGPVAGPLIRDDMTTARINLARLVDIFGRDGVFVEVMDHGIAAERKVIPGLVALATEFGLPVVATNDAHYTGSCDAQAHDAWLASGASKGKKIVLVTDAKRFRFNGAGYHLRTAAEMHDIFDSQPGTQRAVTSSLLIAERIEDDIVLGSLPKRPRMPKYVVPPGFANSDQYFHARLAGGLVRRYGSPLPEHVKRQARLEEDTIRTFDACEYMLTVADAIARERARGGLIGAGRGSSGGSLAAYALGITNMEPLGNNLLFERFMNPDRKGLPDVDTDSQASRRDGMIRDLMEVFGDEYVARIGTTGAAWAKQSLKKIGGVTGQSALGTRLASMVPDGDPKKMTLAALMDPGHPLGAELRAAAEKDPAAATLIATAAAVEGNPSNESVHACGVVIGDEPLAGMVPLRYQKPDDPTSFPVTQWSYKEVEEAGLTKYDFLAIKDLDVVADAIRLVKETTGEQLDFDTMNPNEVSPRADATWDMLAAGRTAGVFQLASTGITKLTTGVRPRTHDDLAAILGLYRPGPMGAGMHDHYAMRRRGGASIDYDIYTKVPAEQEVIAGDVGDTLGLVVYQEQIMALSKSVAAFTPSKADDLRSAIGKKKQEAIDAMYPAWIEGGMSPFAADGSGKVAFQRETLDGLWRVFKSSGEYAFNRSHAFGYALLTWAMAYLKANWPAQFGTALLIHTDKDSKRAQVLADLVSIGVPVLPPHVNVGQMSTTTTTSGQVVIGLSEVKGVGEAARDIIVARESGGSFTSVADLVERTGITSTAVTALAEAGALDEFGSRLGTVMAARAMRSGATAVPDAEWGVVERSARQRIRLGVAIGEHPLSAMRPQLAAWRETTLRGAKLHQVDNVPSMPGYMIHVAGVVSEVTEKLASGGKRCFLTLESASGATLEVAVFADQYRRWHGEHGTPAVGSILAVTGRTRVYVPPRTEDEDDDVVREPVVSVTADRLWVGPLQDPPRPTGPAPDAVMTLSLAPAPALDPPRHRVVAAPELAPEPVMPVPPLAEPVAAGLSARSEPVVVSSRTAREVSVTVVPRGSRRKVLAQRLFAPVGLDDEMSTLFPALTTTLVSDCAAPGTELLRVQSAQDPSLTLVIVSGDRFEFSQALAAVATPTLRAVG